MIAKLMTQSAVVPQGATLLGWIDKHPADDAGLGYGVLRMAAGIEVAWDGQSIRSLPSNWRARCKFVAARNRPAR